MTSALPLAEFFNDLVHMDWRALTLVRAALVVLLAGLAVRALRRAPAADRHSVWTLALVLCGALPLIGAWVAGPARESVTLISSSPVQAVVVLWSVGVLIVAGRTLAGLIALRRLRASAEFVRDPEWQREAEDARVRLRIRVRVELRSSENIAVPITFGWRRPVLVLPPDCGDWTPDRRRAVILHEMAHVSRRDWIAQLAALALCAAYWFHPLVWWATARRRSEAERACDEVVVAHGISPRAYASHLLAFAERARIPSPTSAIAFSRPSVRELESRIRGVLLPAEPRGRRRNLLSAAMVVGVAVASVAFSAPAPVCAMTQSAMADRISPTLDVSASNVDAGITRLW